jgi:predicted MFS family arabinose efflux permease
MRTFSKLGLGAVTAATMATSTFAIVVASVLAVQLIDEFEISRAQIGVLALANGIVGALMSPLFGRITDWLGSVRAVTGALVTGAVTLAIWAVSPSYEVLVAGALLTGLANAWGNPATNALIVDTVPPGDRGVVTGIKQSGVQIGTFLGGLLLPLFAGWWSWRVAILLFLTVPVGGLIAMIGRHDVERHEQRPARSTERLPISVRWVAAYGTISGLATSAMIVFLPLFANEHLGWSETAGGAMVALVGFAGVFARILWPRFSERRIGHGPTLRILASLSTVSAILLALTSLDVVGGWALFPAVALLGGGAVAWNAVGMLAVMDFSPEGGVGKGTGFVLLGFLTGLALGPPLMGLSVDQLGTYTAGWIGAAALLSFSALLSFRVPSGTIIAKA